MKTKEDLDPIMIELKKLVFKKAFKVFSKVWFFTKVNCMFKLLMSFGIFFGGISLFLLYSSGIDQDILRYMIGLLV